MRKRRDGGDGWWRWMLSWRARWVVGGQWWSAQKKWSINLSIVPVSSHYCINVQTTVAYSLLEWVSQWCAKGVEGTHLLVNSDQQNQFQLLQKTIWSICRQETQLSERGCATVVETVKCSLGVTQDHWKVVPFKSLGTVSYSHPIGSIYGRIFSRFDTIHERDRHQAGHRTTARAELCSLARLQSHGKNEKNLHAVSCGSRELTALPARLPTWWGNVTPTLAFHLWVSVPFSAKPPIDHWKSLRMPLDSVKTCSQVRYKLWVCIRDCDKELTFCVLVVS